MKIHVGNLNFDTDEAALRAAFAEHGEVSDVAVVTDRHSGRHRGFGFVTMPDDDARAAIGALDGRELDGRAITVSEARSSGPGGGDGARRGGR